MLILRSVTAVRFRVKQINKAQSLNVLLINTPIFDTKSVWRKQNAPHLHVSALHMVLKFSGLKILQLASNLALLLCFYVSSRLLYQLNLEHARSVTIVKRDNCEACQTSIEGEKGNRDAELTRHR